MMSPLEPLDAISTKLAGAFHARRLLVLVATALRQIRATKQVFAVGDRLDGLAFAVAQLLEFFDSVGRGAELAPLSIEDGRSLVDGLRSAIDSCVRLLQMPSLTAIDQEIVSVAMSVGTVVTHWFDDTRNFSPLVLSAGDPYLAALATRLPAINVGGHRLVDTSGHQDLWQHPTVQREILALARLSDAAVSDVSWANLVDLAREYVREPIGAL